MDSHEPLDSADLIAVVGMAGRFPGAPDVDSLWDLMMDRREAIRPVPADRWDGALQPDPRLTIPQVGGFLDDIDRFDAGFFGVSPREAAAMDPQQRLLLEAGWRALEDAGQRASAIAGSRTGVYVATVWHDYELLRKARGARSTSHTLVGMGRDILANRLSYLMKLRGPSLAVDTGCSSGLVALDLAVRALRHGDIEAAIVGSTNLMMDPHVTVGLTHFGGLSPDGRCASFAKSANGFVRGEGVAAVYLKTLRQAIEDGDRVHGVIVSTLTNNDGGGHSLVSPSQEGQEDLLRRSYRDATVPAAALSYVEAHGTGTKRGDPTEAGALGAVLGRARPAGDPLPIGSIKTNIGHLEGSSGLAGLIKVLLALRHRVVPPTLHAEELNPDIPFGELNLDVVREPLPLPADGPIYLGVNSFGWGGTNAHVIVASPPPVEAPGTPAEPLPGAGLPPLVTLSAQHASRLAEKAGQLRDWLPDEVPVAEVAGALAWRRDHFVERAAIVADDTRRLRTALAHLAGTPAEDAEVISGRALTPGRVAFLFPGQGSQWLGMGRDLYRDSELFASVVDRCAKALAPHVDWDLLDVFAGGSGVADTWIERTDVLQPALWAMSLGLAELWQAAGIVPDVVLGTSQGEITAATLAGALSYDAAALILARRGALIAGRVSGRGLMLAVDLDRAAAIRAMDGFEDCVSFAAHNGPESSVLSGDAEHILALKELLEADGVHCGLVNIDYASHSAGMRELTDDMMTLLAPIHPKPARTPIMSTVLARLIDGVDLDADYWVRNLCEPIEFLSAITALFDDGVTHVVEISPHPVVAPALEKLAATRPETPAVLTTLRRKRGGVRDVAVALARAYTSGLEPFGLLPRGRHLPVPGYPLHGERFWPEPGRRRSGTASGFDVTLTPAAGRAGVWHGNPELSLEDQPWLGDHKLFDAAILPATGMLTLVLNTAAARTGATPPRLSELAFRKEVRLGPDVVRLTTEWRDAPAGGGHVRLLSLAEGATEWDVVATGRAGEPGPAVPAPDFPDWLDDLEPADPKAFYRRVAEFGQVYGPAFRSLRSLYRHPTRDEAAGEVRLPDGLRPVGRPDVPHPALWDAALQVSLALNDDGEALLPTAVRAVHLLASPSAPVRAVWSHVLRRPDGTLDVHLFDADRQPLLVMYGIVLRPLPTGATADGDAELLHRIAWSEVPAEPAAAPGDGHWIVCGADLKTQALAGALTAAGAEVRHRDADVHLAQPLGDAAGVVFVAPDFSAGLGAQQHGLNHLTSIVRACAALPRLPRFVVVTDRAQLAGGAEFPDPGAALYWGYGRVLQREHPELEPRLIDVDVDDDGWAAACSAAILSAAGADQLALRGGRHLAARIVTGEDTPPELPPWRTGRQPYRLGPAPDLSVRALPQARGVPGPDEVEIEVFAGVLSATDARVLADSAAGRATEEPPLGRECVGRITAAGERVQALAVGDRVVAVVPGALAGHVLAPADHVVWVPEHLTDAQAAALSMPVLTAWHALGEAGRIAAGETVLVHFTAVPDGLAAVRVARIHGARPLVVAPVTAADRDLLIEAGAACVADVWDASWPDTIRAAAGGRGVDLAVGPRTSPAVARLPEAVAGDGRIVEVVTGAEGLILDRETAGAGVSLIPVDLERLRTGKPLVFGRLLESAWELIEDGRIPPLPVRAVDASALVRAAAEIDHDHDRTRLVLTGLDRVDDVTPEPLRDGALRADGAYLITGGLGALGLSLAEFLAARGAGALVLTGRSAPGEDVTRRLDVLRERGVRVETPRCDVTDRSALRQALAGLRDDGLPALRGVVHAAGVVADATIANLAAPAVAEVLRPKVDGVRNLESVTAGEPLDFFVLFSSVAGLVGNPGQAAYAAANAYLDAFAESRRMRGLPALSVQWGPFAEIGLAAKNPRAGARLAERGLGSVQAGQGWTALTRLLHQPRPVTGYVPIDARRWFDAYPGTASLSAWSGLYAGLKDDSAPATGSALRTRLLESPADGRLALVEAAARDLAAQVLRLDPSRVERDVLFDSLGLDSLMSLELRNRLEAEFGLRLSPTLLWTYGTLQALSGALLAQLSPPDGAR